MYSNLRKMWILYIQQLSLCMTILLVCYPQLYLLRMLSCVLSNCTSQGCPRRSASKYVSEKQRPKVEK